MPGLRALPGRGRARLPSRPFAHRRLCKDPKDETRKREMGWGPECLGAPTWGNTGLSSPAALWPSFVLDTEQGLGETASHPPSPGPSHPCLSGDSPASAALPPPADRSCGRPERECGFLSASATRRLPLGGGAGSRSSGGRPALGDRQTGGRQMGDKARPLPFQWRGGR